MLFIASGLLVFVILRVSGSLWVEDESEVSELWNELALSIGLRSRFILLLSNVSVL